MARVFLAGIVVEGRRCVVFGGDREAHAKARSLAEAGADIDVVTPDISDPDFGTWLQTGRARRTNESPRIDHTEGAFLVVSAIRDEAWSRALFTQATAPGGFLLCCIDQPAYCTFTNVATVRRGPMQIGIASDGAAPMLAARMRESLDAGLDEEFARFAQRLGELRAEADPAKRREVIARALDGFAMDVRVTLPKA